MESEYEESMFPFLLILFDNLVTYDPVKSRLLESKQKRKNQLDLESSITIGLFFCFCFQLQQGVLQC